MKVTGSMYLKKCNGNVTMAYTPTNYVFFNQLYGLLVVIKLNIKSD